MSNSLLECLVVFCSCGKSKALTKGGGVSLVCQLINVV